MSEFRQRQHELNEHVQLFAKLSQMPERLTEKDLQRAIYLMSRAAEDLGRLMDARLPGCVCRRIEDENYSRLVYEKTCTHHSSLFHQEKALEEGYAKAEKALKDEARMKLVAAALSGAAGLCETTNDLDDEDLAKRAISIADETIRRITTEVG